MQNSVFNLPTIQYIYTKSIENEIQFNSHATVSLLVLVINVIWLLPIAFFVANKQLAGTTGVVVAYVPLLVAALALNAGKDSVTN